MPTGCQEIEKHKKTQMGKNIQNALCLWLPVQCIKGLCKVINKIFCHSYETAEHMGKQTNRQIRQFDWLGGEIHTHFAMFWLGG